MDFRFLPVLCLSFLLWPLVLLALVLLLLLDRFVLVLLLLDLGLLLHHHRLRLLCFFRDSVSDKDSVNEERISFQLEQWTLQTDLYLSLYTSFSFGERTMATIWSRDSCIGTRTARLYSLTRVDLTVSESETGTSLPLKERSRVI